MALFHFHVTQIKRSARQSAIASAAYRFGEKLLSEYSDYTKKGGVVCSNLLLPAHVPPQYKDRQTLWKTLEKAERGKKAQLAYSFDIALQNELSLEENIALARQFLEKEFVSRGMVIDFAVHQPIKKKTASPILISMCFVQSVPFFLTEHGAKNKNVCLNWISLETGRKMKRDRTFPMRFPRLTGKVMTPWNTGEKAGLTYVMQSLKKRI